MNIQHLAVHLGEQASLDAPICSERHEDAFTEISTRQAALKNEFAQLALQHFRPGNLTVDYVQEYEEDNSFHVRAAVNALFKTEDGGVLRLGSRVDWQTGLAAPSLPRSIIRDRDTFDLFRLTEHPSRRIRAKRLASHVLANTRSITIGRFAPSFVAMNEALGADVVDSLERFTHLSSDDVQAQYGSLPLDLGVIESDAYIGYRGDYSYDTVNFSPDYTLQERSKEARLHAERMRLMKSTGFGDSLGKIAKGEEETGDDYMKAAAKYIDATLGLRASSVKWDADAELEFNRSTHKDLSRSFYELMLLERAQADAISGLAVKAGNRVNRAAGLKELEPLDLTEDINIVSKYLKPDDEADLD